VLNNRFNYHQTTSLDPDVGEVVTFIESVQEVERDRYFPSYCEDVHRILAENGTLDLLPFLVWIYRESLFGIRGRVSASPRMFDFYEVGSRQSRRTVIEKLANVPPEIGQLVRQGRGRSPLFVIGPAWRRKWRKTREAPSSPEAESIEPASRGNRVRSRSS
jgi:hypothetical protein